MLCRARSSAGSGPFVSSEQGNRAREACWGSGRLEASDITSTVCLSLQDFCCCRGTESIRSGRCAVLPQRLGGIMQIP